MKNIYFLLLFCCASILSAQVPSELSSNKSKKANALTSTTQYSWETPQATVLPNGDLQWAPLPFQLIKGASVRYIDFENGLDSNDGLTTGTAWKHHPWDASASGNALAGSGIQTYIFKRGVVYRGLLTAKEGGVTGNPIRLTSDPNWGIGEAGIYGSIRVTSGWTKANSTIAPKIPNPDLVWYQTINGIQNQTKVICEVTPTSINRVYLARSPNYVNTPLEPMQTWWSFTNKVTNGTQLQLTDTKNLIQTPADYYKGGDVWATEDVVVMCTLWKQQISDYNPATKTITVADQNFGGVKCKYYVENTPYMLDSPGEYFYDNTSGKVFIRLENDKDPNTTTIEIGSKSNLLNTNSKNNIEISGLTFGFTTYNNVRFGEGDGMPVIKVANSSNVVISNCKFQYVNGGVVASGTSKNFVFTDNEMNFMDDFSLFLQGADDVSILRNKIFENGTRHLGRWYSSIPAITGTITTGEIAGNIIEHAWGGGLNFTWGKGSGDASTIPFIRGLVHHNKVLHSLQGVNDYGGIEGWQGGPVFTYNNISSDAQGWKYNTGTTVSSLGYPFYFDGGFKQYVFNNIVWGQTSYKTAAAFNQVLGYYNMYTQNIAYNLASLTGSGGGNLASDGSNYYLANVNDSTWRTFNHNTRASGIPTESFCNNFFSAKPFTGNFLDGTPNGPYNFEDFVTKLNTFNPDLGQVGYETSQRVFENPSSGDFRPTVSSELIDRGVKVFVPFPLSKVVAEWNFQKHKADSSIIKGENFYFTSEFTNRETYKNVPKNNLKVYGLSANSFVKGNLEDWTESALVFDGMTTYCSSSNALTTGTLCNKVDFETYNTIIECYLKTVPENVNGTILSKYGTVGYGYQLNVDGTGNIAFKIFNNGSEVYSQVGATIINDGNWHHILVENNRTTITSTFYIDGVLSQGATTGVMPNSNSISNTSDLLIGKNKDGNFFAGTIDFMRISKGLLSEAKTTIDELYKWEFNGPFLRDFAGVMPIGLRDAGALERGTKLCNMTTSSNTITFDQNGGTKAFTINAEKGFSITKQTSNFFSYTIDGNTVTVSVPAKTLSTKLSGDIWILGCNETQKVKVIQQTLTGINIQKQSEIHVMPNPVSNQQLLSITIPDNLKSIRGIFMDLNGKVIDETTLYSGKNAYRLNFTKGMYILNITSPELNYRTKIVVN